MWASSEIELRTRWFDFDSPPRIGGVAAPLRWLRSIVLMAQSPLLFQQGNRSRPWLAVIMIALFTTSLLAAPNRYSGHGLVLAVNGKTVTISHEKIPGYMDAMVMPFKVKDAALLKGVERGRQVYFRLAVEKDESYIDHIVVTSADPVDPSKWQTPVVSQLVHSGEMAPDFRLVDHNRQPVSLSQFRGKLVAVNFIYTRCPLPDYCPRMTDNFAGLKKRFKDRLGKDLVLLTITIDPQYDTPEILKAYAKVFGGGEAQGWYYLTGSKQEITRVSGSFGLEYWPDEGTIMHNLQTGIIDRDGRMAANVEGKEYSSRQLGDLVEGLLGR